MRTSELKYYILNLIVLVLTVTSNLSYANRHRLHISVPDFPPFNGFTEHEDCVGASVLAIEAVTKGLRLKLELASYPYARILHSLKTGELDLALIFKNTTIAHDVEYIGPLSLSKVIVLTQQNNTIQHYDGLYLLEHIAVIRNAQFNEKFDRDKALNKIHVDNYKQAIHMLKNNRVDGVIGSRVGLEYALRQQDMDNSFMTNAFDLGSKELGLHLSKKSPYITLLPALKTAVKNNYQADLIYRLYQFQVRHCLPTK